MKKKKGSLDKYLWTRYRPSTMHVSSGEAPDYAHSDSWADECTEFFNKNPITF